MTTSRITRSMAKALQTPAGADPENQDFGKTAHGDPIRRTLAFNDATNTPAAPMSTVRRSRRVLGLEPDAADALQAVPLAQPILEDENQNQQQDQEEGEDEEEEEDNEQQQHTPADTEVMEPGMYSPIPALEAAAAAATPGVALPSDASFEHDHDQHEHGGPSGPPPTPVGAPAPSPAQEIAAAAVEMLGRATPGHTVRQEEHFWGPGGEEASRGIMEGALPLSPVPQGRPEISIPNLPSAPGPTPANTPLGAASASFHLPAFPAASPQPHPHPQGCQDGTAIMGDADNGTPVHPAFLAPTGGTPGGASQMNTDSSPAPSEATMVLSPSEWAQDDFAFAVPVIPQAQAAEEAGACGPRAFPGFPEVSPLVDTHSPMDTDMGFAFSPAPEVTATKTKEALFYSPELFEAAADIAGPSGACCEPAAGAGAAPAPLVIPSELHGLSLRQLKRRIRALMEAREAQARAQALEMQTQQAAGGAAGAAASPLSDVYSMRDTPEARSGGGAVYDGELVEDMDGEEEEGDEGGYTPLSAAEEEEVAALLAGGALLLRGLPAPAGRHIRFEDAPTPN